jgi:hypothetical protein
MTFDLGHFPSPSWPGLARPSTFLPLQKEGVDARDEPGHDETYGGAHAL